MNIRAKLTFRFTVIVAAIILLLSSFIYYFSADYRKSEFYGRLKDRGVNTAKLLIDVDEVNTNLLNIIEPSFYRRMARLVRRTGSRGSNLCREASGPSSSRNLSEPLDRNTHPPSRPGLTM